MDDVSIGALLDRLAKFPDVPLCQDAARTIRRLTECLTMAEIERDAAEVSAWAHAAEIDRVKDHRRAWEERRAAKAGKR